MVHRRAPPRRRLVYGRCQNRSVGRLDHHVRGVGDRTVFDPQASEGRGADARVELG